MKLYQRAKRRLRRLPERGRRPASHGAPRRPATTLTPADVLSLANGFCGLLAIGVLTGVLPVSELPIFPALHQFWPALADNRFLLAAVLVTFGLVLDNLDGAVARKQGGSALGGELETISDAVTFVVTPSLLVMTYYSGPARLAGFMTGSLIFLMGAMRLARFSANPDEKDTRTFQGFPSPGCAMVICLAVLARVPAALALPLIAVTALLMMSSFPYPKSRGADGYLTSVVIGMAVVATGLVWFFKNDWERVMQVVFGLVAVGVVVFPMLMTNRAKRERRLAFEAAAADPDALPLDSTRGPCRSRYDLPDDLRL
ncbi:MAG: CDP-alcohol phosphatidyltransferase family protein [Armatimonadota bacterium]